MSEEYLLMTQTAPYPTELAELVEATTYRPGWCFNLLTHFDRGQGSKGLTLQITTHGYNAYEPDAGECYGVRHLMPVPPAAYTRDSWQRWLFDQVLLVERHECMEFFQVDGSRPYAPNHGPGHDPYTVRELTTVEDRQTSFRGTRFEDPT